MRGDQIVSVNGRDYSQQECFLEALRVDSNFGLPWKSLAKSMEDGETVVVNGKLYTAKQCYVEALRCDPANGAWWWFSDLLEDDEVVASGSFVVRKVTGTILVERVPPSFLEAIVPQQFNDTEVSGRTAKLPPVPEWVFP